MVLTRYLYAVTALLFCSCAQGMCKSLESPKEAPKSPLLRSHSEPSLSAFFIRSGSHDNIIIDIQNPSGHSSSPTQNTILASLKAPLLGVKTKQKSCHKRFLPYLSKGLKLTAFMVALSALFYAGGEIYSAASQLKDGAHELRDKLSSVEDDVALVKETFDMCQQCTKALVACMSQPIQK